MNSTTIYIGSYIKAKMPKTENLSHRRACPLCDFISPRYKYCPEHGVELIPLVENLFASPYDILEEAFGDIDTMTYEFMQDGWVVFLPNRDDLGGLFIHRDEDEEEDIPPVYLEGDWQKLIVYLQQKEITHEIKYGVLTVTEK